MTQLPSTLRDAITADYRAVTPMRPPFVRAAAVVPFALIVLVAAPLWFNVRVDAPRLGWLTLWGASALQTLIGLIVVGAALRESVPGRSWSRGAIAVWIAIPIVLVAAVTMASWQASPIVLRREWWLVTAICFGCSLASSLPVVALSSVLAARAYPTRPAIAGLLLGFGAGLMADAGWRIFCHFSEPAHVFSAHLAAVVASAIVGSAAAVSLNKAAQRGKNTRSINQ